MNRLELKANAKAQIKGKIGILFVISLVIAVLSAIASAILFFIPGTPKDALTYIAPLAPMGTLKYLLITTLARIPSVVTSTVLGDRVAEGDYTAAIIVFAVCRYI